jgi:hypothetical protein
MGAAVTVEDPGAAGLSGSDISETDFRLAAGVTVGGQAGGHTAVPPRPVVPPPPPLPRMRLGHRPDGVEMSARPRADLAEFSRDWKLMSRPVAYLLLAAACIITGLIVALISALPSWGIHL